MRPVLIALVCLAAAGLASARLASLNEWRAYKNQHQKVYDTPEEDARRFALYLAAKNQIQQHNAKNLSYKLGLNHLSDWTAEEFSRLNGYRNQSRQTGQAENEAMAFLEQLMNNTDVVPDELDWRKHPGRVTEVKDQGNCGSCWAFSTVAALEGQEVRRRKGKKVRSLSPQELLDCSVHNYGCGGGYPGDAMQDICSLGGVETFEDYPYKAKQGKCQFVKAKAVMSDDGAYEYNNKGENVLKNLVAKFGPVSIGTASDNWNLYDSGVFDDEQCQDNLDHAVLVVGYGTDPMSGDFWIVKNSWGKNWGENGYIRIKRGVSRCGLGKTGIVPKFAD